MRGSPYRAPSRAELVVHAEPLVTVYVWAIWGGAVALVVVLFTVDSVSLARAVSLAIVAAVVCVLLLWRRSRRRVRWRFVLERSQLRIERLASDGAAPVGGLDVAEPVRVRIEFSRTPGLLDACLVISSGEASVQCSPGIRLGFVSQQLVAFLRAHDVSVEEPPELPPLRGPFF